MSSMITSTPKMLRPSNLNGLADQAEQPVDVAQLLSVGDRVGGEIKNLRKARGITLDALSEAAGLSKGYLSQIERGVSSPSVKALHSISRALGVTISWFFPSKTDDEDDLRDYVVRASSRRKLTFVGGITDELLSPNLGRQLELLRCTFPPGSESGKEPYTHQGEEAGVVISGRLDLWIGERHVVLSEGDSFAFASDLPHRYANTSDRECVVIWSVTPPSY
ncbi:XRE family transcriptional regulator [Bradyrhizobium sp. 30]|uniref:helix-turn-helix domain-containing protein n=1 Tax=Bradyrhizobium sp. 30 TaxID=2782669 RepID=UPI001FF7DA5A|nr:XRE family transcriptional regulator [Bradyrhizobium sp. 30]